MNHFSKTLARLRAEAGFKTSYAFYHRNGGKRTFPFTYAYYVKIERGKSLPRAEWLPLIISLLRIRPTESAQQGLVLDYLRDLVADEEAFRSLVSPLLAARKTAQPEKLVIKRLLSDSSYHLTPAQFRTVLSSPEAYWTFNCLINSSGPLGVEEIAESTGFKKPELLAALKALAAKKMAKRASQGRYASPLARHWCVYPRDYPGYERDLKRLEGYIASMSAKRGRSLMKMGTLIRTDRSMLSDAMGSLRETIEKTSAFSVYEPGEETGFYVLEASVRRIMPF